MSAHVLPLNFVLTSRNQTAVAIIVAIILRHVASCVVLCIMLDRSNSAQGIALHFYSHIFRSDTTHQKRDWFKMCYCGSKDKEASDSLIRVFKPHIY